MKQHKIGPGIAFAVALGIAAPSFAQEAVQWRVEDGGNGHWYSRIHQQMPWNAARDAAVGFGGYLVTCTSEAEWLFVKSAVSVVSAWAGGYQNHLHSSYSEPSGGWMWVSGERFTLASYMGMDDCPAGPPPDCVCGAGAQDALFFTGCCNNILDDIQDGSASDCNYYPGDEPTGFIIEWSADCDADGVVDYGQILDGELNDTNGNGVPDCCDQGVECPMNLLSNGGFRLNADGWTSMNIDSAGGWRDTGGLPGGMYIINHIGAASDPAIQQTVNGLVPAAVYRLSGDFRGMYIQNSPPGGISFAVDVDGSPAFTAASLDLVTWRRFAVEFTAAGTSATFRIRSEINGTDNDFAVDNVSLVLVTPSCPADINQSGNIDAEDLAYVLFAWGMTGGKAGDADINGDATVDASDLSLVLGSWGPCPD